MAPKAMRQARREIGFSMSPLKSGLESNPVNSRDVKTRCPSARGRGAYSLNQQGFHLFDDRLMIGTSDEARPCTSSPEFLEIEQLLMCLLGACEQFLLCGAALDKRCRPRFLSKSEAVQHLRRRGEVVERTETVLQLL